MYIKLILTIFVLLYSFDIYAAVSSAWKPLNIISANENVVKMIPLSDKKTTYLLTYTETTYIFYANYRTYHLYKIIDGGSQSFEVSLYNNKLEITNSENKIDIVADTTGTLYELNTDGNKSAIYSSKDSGNNWLWLCQSYPLSSYLLIDRHDHLYAVNDSNHSIIAAEWKGYKWQEFPKINGLLHEAHHTKGMFDNDDHLFFAEAVSCYDNVIYKISSDNQIDSLPIPNNVKGRIEDFIIDNNTDHFYLTTLPRGIYQSIDKGITWTSISDDIEHSKPPHYDRGYASPVINHKGSLFVIKNELESIIGACPTHLSSVWGLIHTTNHQSTHWYFLDIGGSRSFVFGDIYYDPYVKNLFIDNNDYLYATGVGYVYVLATDRI